jgi:hypothetical protein
MVWLDFLPYARRLFAGGNGDLWVNPALFLSVYSQGQGLLKSDVLSISIQDFYTAWVAGHPETVQAWMGKKPTFALKKLLALEEPKNRILEILSGLENLYQKRYPLVLAFPSPQKWLQSLHGIVQREGGAALAGEDVDAAAMYLADYLRSYSATGLSAIVIEESDSPFLALGEAAQLYQPVLNVAGHYQWPAGIRMDSTNWDIEELANGFDFYLLAQKGLADLLPLWEKRLPCVGGLNHDFWVNGQPLPTLPSFRLLYGRIPEDAQPEKVLERLNELRS